MIARSDYISSIGTRAEAIAWLNNVRPGNATFEQWIKTVTHHYNGCIPSRCRVYNQRFQHYRDNAMSLYNEFGDDFWYLNGAAAASSSAPVAVSNSIRGVLRRTRDVHLEPFDVDSRQALRAELSGPSSADFDLYLMELGETEWRSIASSTSGSSEEVVETRVGAGTYAWYVVSYSGAGEFSLSF